MIFYKYRKVWYTASTAVLVAGALAISFWGLPLGIDFTGGSVAEVTAPAINNADHLRANLKEKGIEATVSSTGQNGYIIKFANPKQEGSARSDIPSQDLVKGVLGEQGSVVSFNSIGPTVGNSLQKKALMAIATASLAIIIYLAWAFQGVSKVASAWSFGFFAVIALLHDAGIVTGLFAIIGHFNANITIDTYFITALLTIIGYSVNDTIVIFDRLREVLKNQANLTIGEAVEVSIAQTLARSLNTSLTVLLVLIPMLILGRGSLQSFLTALTIGVVVGTYSSIFIAAPLIATWQGYKQKRQSSRAASKKR